MPSSQDQSRASKLMQPRVFASKLISKDEHQSSSNSSIMQSSNESIAARNNQMQRMSRLKQPSIPATQDKNKNIEPSNNGNLTETKSFNSFSSINNSTNDLLCDIAASNKNSKGQKPSKLPASLGIRSSSAIAKLSIKTEKLANSDNNLNHSPQRRFKSSERSLNSITDTSESSNNKIITSLTEVNLSSQLPIFTAKNRLLSTKVSKQKDETTSKLQSVRSKIQSDCSVVHTADMQINEKRLRTSSSNHSIVEDNSVVLKLPVSNKKESKLPTFCKSTPKLQKVLPVQQNSNSKLMVKSPSMNSNIVSMHSDEMQKDQITIEDNSKLVPNTPDKEIENSILEASHVTPMQPLALQSPFLRMAKETLSNKNHNKLFLSSTKKSNAELAGSSDSLEDILSSVAATEDNETFDVAHLETNHFQNIRNTQRTRTVGTKPTKTSDSHKVVGETGYASDGDLLSSSDKRISSGYISDGASSISEWMRARSQNLSYTDKCSLSNSDDNYSVISDQINGHPIKTIVNSTTTNSTVPKINIQLPPSSWECNEGVRAEVDELDSNFNRTIKARSTLPVRGKKAILPLDGFAQKSHQEFNDTSVINSIKYLPDEPRFVKSPSVDSKSMERLKLKVNTVNEQVKLTSEPIGGLNPYGRKSSLVMSLSDDTNKNVVLNFPQNNKQIDNAHTKEIIDAYISKYSKSNNTIKQFNSPMHNYMSCPIELGNQMLPHHHHHQLPKSPYSSLGRSTKLSTMRPPSFLTCPHTTPSHHMSPGRTSIKEDDAWDAMEASNLMQRRGTDIGQFLDVRSSPMHRRNSNYTPMCASNHRTSNCSCQERDLTIVNTLPISQRTTSKMGDSLNGSSLSLGSCSSLFSNVEDYNIHEIRRLRRELELAQTHVSSLNMQLNINENVVQAFEQSVASLNARLQCLTFLAGDKASHLGELQAAMNQIKNSRSFCSHHHSTLNTEDDVSSEGPDLEKKKRQKKWLTSIGKAFNRKRSKQQNDAVSNLADSANEIEIKNENELIRQLEMRLQEREMKLTDAQLDALTSAHQLDLLRNAMSQMQKEMMTLKNDNTRLQQLISTKRPESLTSNKMSVSEEPACLSLSLYVRSSNSSQANKSSEILISNFFSEKNTTWASLEQMVAQEFKNYLCYIDATDKLGLSANSIDKLQVGDLQWKLGCLPETVSPSSKLVGLNQSVTITLHGAQDDAVDSMAFDLMISCSWLQKLVGAFECKQAILFNSNDSIAVDELATKLAFYFFDRLSDAKARVIIVDASNEGDVQRLLEDDQMNFRQIVLLRNFSVLPSLQIMDQLIHISELLIGTTGGGFETCAWLPSASANLHLVNLDAEMQSSDAEDELLRFFKRNFIEYYAAQRFQNEEKNEEMDVDVVEDEIEPDDGSEKFVRGVLGHLQSGAVRSAMQMWGVLGWIVKMRRHVDDFIVAHSSRAHSFGARLYISCPMDYQLSLLWFQNLWNYSIVPRINVIIRNFSNKQKICEGWIDPTEFIIDTCPWTNCDAATMFVPVDMNPTE